MGSKLKVGLIIHDDDVVNVFFFYNDKRKLVRKLWIYPEGEVRYCDFDESVVPTERPTKTILSEYEG